jgi:hypothetical protein
MAGDRMETKQVIPKFLKYLVLNSAFSSAQSIDLELRERRPSASDDATLVFHVLPIGKDDI